MALYKVHGHVAPRDMRKFEDVVRQGPTLPTGMKIVFAAMHCDGGDFDVFVECDDHTKMADFSRLYDDVADLTSYPVVSYDDYLKLL